MALLSSVACELAPLRIVLLCVFLYLFFFIFLLLFWYVYRLQWLCTTEEQVWTLDNATTTWSKDRYSVGSSGAIGDTPEHRVEQRPPENNRRRRRKHRGRTCWNIATDWASQPSSTEFLLAMSNPLENKMDDLRARISFQRDIRDCNSFCFTETWAHALGPGHRCKPSVITSLFYGWDRSAEAGKKQRWW